MNYFPQQSSGSNANLIQQAAFDYLNNSFSKNPAQPLVQPPGQNQKQGSVSQPPPPQNNLGKASSAAGMMSAAGMSF